MKITSVHVRRFRGLESASLVACAGLNVLIGRNNAGKSSVLAAIETGLRHLVDGRIAAIWATRNQPIDEFTRRSTEKPIQIGITFQLNQDLNVQIRERILASSAGLEVAINHLQSCTAVSVIFSGILDEGDAVLFVEQIGLGEIDCATANLNILSNKIMQVGAPLARELARRERSFASMRNDISAIDKLDRSMVEYTYRDGGPSRARRFREFNSRANGSADFQNKIDKLFIENDSSEKFNAGLVQLKSSYELDIDELAASPTTDSMLVFSGNVNGVPEYVTWLLRQLGDGDTLSFKEVRNAIGREEAGQILRLKTKRGGAEALARVQGTVKSLLGVQVDAFEPESPSVMRRGVSEAQAEMDVDDFLVEANGAGIREALRIILDLELKNPELAFIEEPEVHLHPGLERVLHGYLVGKSKTIQLFVATHSANFLDASARQNVYLVSRNDQKMSEVQKVASEGDLLKISEEVGLRPSTVLMFDRLVFVEGPSDEAILGELIRKLDLDISSSSTAFVQMGGASRFAHYAAEATLRLLSRRQIKLWFVIDKDERDDTDVTRLLDKLGDRAELMFLGRREIENYLLFAEPICSLISEKLESSEPRERPSLEEIETLIKSTAEGLLERAIELRVAKIMLKPVYAQYGGNNIRERLVAMSDAISAKASTIDATESLIRDELTPNWTRDATKLAPGSEILDAIFSKYGCRYKKEVDGRRLAERIDPTKLDTEIVRFLRKVATIQ